MESGKKHFFEMSPEELYAYAMGAGTARLAIIRSQEANLPFTFDQDSVLIGMPEELPRQYTDLYMSGFSEVAAEAIAKTEHSEVA